MSEWIEAGTLAELKEKKAKVIKGGIAVFHHDGELFAVDNRCPHMGFPLHMGSLCDRLLTCHWHHARFDVAGGGTLDPWADDVPVYPVKLDGDIVRVGSKPLYEPSDENRFQRLEEGLEQNLSLVIAKSVVALLEQRVPPERIA